MFGRLRRSEEMVGFALSGGGARGAVQVGAIKALLEAGISPQLLAGTSAGAINAAWFALHPDQMDKLEALWLGLRRCDVFPGGRLTMLLNLTRHGHMHSSRELEDFLRRQVGDARFEDCPIPCAVVAVRLSDGKRMVFDQGEIVPAVMASAAIPGVYPPYRIGDELYVDGGLLEYLPVPTILERGASTVYALDLSWFDTSSPYLGSVMERCSLISVTEDVRRVTSLQVTRGRTIHLLRPEIREVGDPRDFSQTARLIRIGYEHARSYLQQEARSQRRATVGSSHTAS